MPLNPPFRYNRPCRPYRPDGASRGLRLFFETLLPCATYIGQESRAPNVTHIHTLSTRSRIHTHQANRTNSLQLKPGLHQAADQRVHHARSVYPTPYDNLR